MRYLYQGYTDGAVDVPTICPEKSLTRQSEAEGADINVIMKRYEKTGVLPLPLREAAFADVSDYTSFQEVMQAVVRGTESFMALPAKARERFGNDPVRFLDEVGGLSPVELEELGLVEKAAEAVPAPVQAPEGS